MHQKSMDLDADFLQLIKDEEYAISTGLPKLTSLNDRIDIQFLCYKLRLLVRVLVYRNLASFDSIDLAEEDFSEVKALVDRRPELRGMSPVLNTFWKQAQLLLIDRKGIQLNAFEQLVDYHDTYENLFSPQETRDFADIMEGFAYRLINEGRYEFSPFAILMAFRIIERKYRGKTRMKKGEYLNGTNYANIGVLSVVHFADSDLAKLLNVNDFSQIGSISTIQEWSKAFIDYYSKFLDPSIRKLYRNYLRGAICFHYQEYAEVIKIYTNFSVPDNDVANISVKRCLFCATYSLLYHGTTAERRMLRRRNLSLDLQLDRMRKHLEYLREERPTIHKFLQPVVEGLGELKKLYAIRRLVEKGEMSMKGREQYLRQKALINPECLVSSPSTKKWLQSELIALP